MRAYYQYLPLRAPKILIILEYNWRPQWKKYTPDFVYTVVMAILDKMKIIEYFSKSGQT